MRTFRNVESERQRVIVIIIGWPRGGDNTKSETSMTLHFMQSGKPYSIGQRPQFSLLTYHHICANKHHTPCVRLQKVWMNVGLVTVYLGNFLFIPSLPCFFFFSRKLSMSFRPVLQSKTGINYPISIWYPITAFLYPVTIFWRQGQRWNYYLLLLSSYILISTTGSPARWLGAGFQNMYMIIDDP